MRRRLGLLVGLVGAVVAVVLVMSRPASAPVLHTPAAAALRVRANRLLLGPGAGQVVQLRGINRSGSEYECLLPDRVFDGPEPARADSAAAVSEMLTWQINAVRLPLNEGCWLGTNTSGTTGAAYRAAIEAEVRALNARGLLVVLVLQWNAGAGRFADSPLPMADAAHAPAFWRSVAATFRTDGWVLYDLFNEPHEISWRCWLRGCEVPAGRFNAYRFRAVGMQALVDAVRSTGSRQPLIISGNDYARDLSGIYRHRVVDPAGQLVYGLHTYGGPAPCRGACLTTVVDAARHFPVIATEFGEDDCATGYITPEMRALDAAGVGYLAWAWDATSPHGWDCSAGPALIENYGGTPTAYGAGFRAHLIGLGAPVRPPARG